MRTKCLFFMAINLIAHFAVPFAMAEEPGNKASLRAKVLAADSGEKAGKAYEAYFLYLGTEGLQKALSDEDTGIALQAAWEVNKRPAKRTVPIPNRTDDLYFREGLIEFRTFLKDRTKVPLPEWWAFGIVEIELFPGRHHACVEWKKQMPELKVSKAGPMIPERAEFERVGESFRYSANGSTVEFPKGTFEGFPANAFIGYIGKKGAAIAACSDAGGFSFKMSGFAGAGGKPIWTADVWATGREFLGGFGTHRVEIVEKDGALFVFGAESHGMYLETFDLATGKCRYRFCTSYWNHFSEAWDRK